MKNKDKIYIKKLISKYSIKENKSYPLSANSFSEEDLIEGIKIILSKRLTMSRVTQRFEKQFAKYIGSKHALMVNSGSSANLLAMFAVINPLNNYKIKKDDECLLPALCWSTSLWPIVQAGLKPIFVDVEPETLNISIKDLKKKISKKTKVIMNVHILGNSSNMKEFMQIVKKSSIPVSELNVISSEIIYSGIHLSECIIHFSSETFFETLTSNGLFFFGFPIKNF